MDAKNKNPENFTEYKNTKYEKALNKIWAQTPTSVPHADEFEFDWMNEDESIRTNLVKHGITQIVDFSIMKRSRRRWKDLIKWSGRVDSSLKD